MSHPSLFAALFGLAAAAAAFAVLPSPSEAEGPAGAAAKSPLDFTVKDIDGKNVPLSKYRGGVVVIVNTASKCGYTPQYAALEGLYQKYKGQGLRVLAFPSNDFGAQEPGTEKEIKEFCTTRYKTTFDLFGKVATRGAAQAPLYKYLTGSDTNAKYAGPVEWNFTKFLVGRDGTVVGRFTSGVDPLSPEFTAAVEAALKAPAPPKKK